MDLNWLSPLCEARPSGEKGWGSFARVPIPAGTTVAAFGGHVVPGDVFRAMPEERQGRSIQVDADLFLLSAITPEPGDMVNHSCEPSCGLRGNMVVVAMRDLAPGDEITFDYAMCDGTDYDEFECVCEAPACRGLVTGNDWRDPVLQAKYAGWFSPYLAARIAAVEA
jgi:SET domain-containing protein